MAKVEQAELANVLRKVQSGKTLTASDWRVLDGHKSKPEASPAEQLYTVNALANLLDRDRRTMTKALAHVTPAGYKGRAKLYRRSDAEAALAARGGNGESYAELRAEQIRQQTRESKARAELLEMERKEKSGELVSLTEVAALVNPILLAVRQRLNAMPSELANLVNPTDPVHAQQQAIAWVERALPIIRAELPQPAKAEQ